MLLADVNIFLYARRKESPDHEAYRDWLEDALSGPQPFGVSELVLSGFIRIVTNHRVYRGPTPPAEALEFCDVILNAPAAVPLRPGPRHWSLFRNLVTETGARGNQVPDAYHAALAIEHGAIWVTTDGGFGRFPGLSWQRPFSG